jgi:3-oxoacyl-[acyl-carrier protein] reductase
MGQGNRRLKGKVSIVTGASRGIGREIALKIATNGAFVALAARSQSGLHQIRKQIADGGGRAIAVPTDVSSEHDVKGLVDTVVRKFGRIDILVNNAGIAFSAPLCETTTKQWDECMAVNARGPFMLCREVVPHMKRCGGGIIINIASVVSVKGYVNQAAYTASKHAVLGMTKVIAQELKGEGIRVHAICPGGVATQMGSTMRPDLQSDVLIQPREIADIVIFILSQRGNAVIDQINVRRAVSDPWF